MKEAHRASVLGLALTGLMVAATAVAVFHREPTVRRETWCPAPEDRAAADRSLERVQVLARLREIRTKFGRLHEGELFEDPDDAPGSVAELDRLLMLLISDYDLATTPPMEARP